MKINGDFDQRVVIDTTVSPWHPSPHPGLAHKLLDCSGEGEVRATSIVQYASGRALPEHDVGEELAVVQEAGLRLVAVAKQSSNGGPSAMIQVRGTAAGSRP